MRTLPIPGDLVVIGRRAMLIENVTDKRVYLIHPATHARDAFDIPKLKHLDEGLWSINLADLADLADAFYR
jgi:hypothetical protein